ncbi:hypothetical protein QBK99_10405 [Corticibacterium sp. UT-5YL-CI-8]|nr:hypothetical protein [Tianweitania sp. UT-5YL-CI-8]
MQNDDIETSMDEKRTDEAAEVSGDLLLVEDLALSVEEAIAVQEAAGASLVGEEEFRSLVNEALEGVGGHFLFKMKLDQENETCHVAAGVVGDGESRQFLLLTLPETGGKLKVETAAASRNPIARITEAYAGVMDAFKAAA